MKIFCYIIISIFFFNFTYSIESKIIYKIQNEIITNIDLKNEFKYLLVLNNRLKDLDKDKAFLISKESLIRDKIKKIEIMENFENLKIDQKYEDILIRNIYLKLELDNKDQFIEYLKKYDLKLKSIIEKITINALWNDLIFRKYSAKIEINEKKIKNKIDLTNQQTTRDFLLSEIVYEVKNKKEINKKFIEIKKSIKDIGFENTVSLFSISASAKTGGNIGWVNEKSLSEDILKNIEKMKDNLTQPIILPNAILVLKINEVKKSTLKIDYDIELKKAIDYERNKQLNQYSIIYFNKIKKNLDFNE
ncbi:peptidylprolyl isomerase [Candidatus Pelagibacter sp. Uisw_127]|uniref:peptidylprolyl isomerase n=1 Tax=Candidatus Pelagibacter sp. Uisw_127 TaxID=3230988 RepID=UPI0039E76431